MPGKSFINGTLILMLAGFIVKIMGFAYRIYLSNLIGAEGMGLFQLISPIYSLIILTLTSGISIAVSKMVAEELTKKNTVNIKRITSLALTLVVSTGTIISILMYFFLDPLVNNIIKDSRTYLSLLLLIPCIPVIAASSALKGYFYALNEVTPTAISQIVEQITRIALVVMMTSAFIKMELSHACALATISMALGEISNLIVLLTVYKFKNRRNKIKNFNAKLLPKRKILKEVLCIAVPTSFNRFITSIMSAIELILIPKMLVSGGYGYRQSMEEFGKLAGMAMPLIYFPALVTSSLATVLVPAISQAMSLKNIKMINYRISKSIQITFIIGFIFTAIFITFSNQIGNMLYRRENIGDLLFSLSFTCIFLYLQQTLLGILNGLGKQVVSLKNSIIGYAIRIAFVYFCIPVYGINAYIWGIIASLVVVCLLNILAIIKTTGLNIDIRNWILRPGIVGLIMVFIGRYIHAFFEIFIINHKLTISMALIGNIAIALTLTVIVGALEKNELLKLIGIKKTPTTNQ